MLPIGFAGFEFRPHLGWTLVAIAGIALTLVLGEWQVGRAQYKEALQSRYELLGRQPVLSIGPGVADRDGLLLRRVEVRGTFDPKYTVFVDNRIYKHQPGFHVATPMRITGSDRYVLVNRGWVASPRDRSVPDLRTPGGEQVVQGLAVAWSERYLELSTKVAEGNIWQNLVYERYRQATGLDVQPVVVQQTSAADDGLVREWNRPDLGRNTHLAYAFQWYALSLAIFVYYLVSHVKRTPSAKP
ncbi:MAG: SURF1 family protein [Burkholderiales bacterium]|nr:SURF1 family protein [Burkholderiales bacterium]MDP2397940.1 SURF1 family protein [Burkholderiales bacterium]